MNKLKNQIKNILWKYWMRRGMQSLKRSDVRATEIKQAIQETINNQISPEEKVWISRIEQIRDQFTGNPTQVTIHDFGAGNPDSQRSEEEMTQGITSTTTYGEISLGSKPARWALLLFKLIRAVQPELAVELGTCIGISAAYQAAAMQLNGKGGLISIEGASEIAVLAEKNFQALGLKNGKVLCGTFKEVLPEIFAYSSALDYVFIDGHHDEQATVDYFELLLPHLSPGALLVFDDISWSGGMRKAWDKISKHPAVLFSIDLKMLGICQM